MGQGDLDWLLGVVDVEQQALLPARRGDLCGKRVSPGGSGIDHVLERLVPAGTAVVQLLATGIAVHEDDLARALGRLAGGRCRNRDHALAIDRNLAVLVGHLHLGNLHLLFGFVGLADVLADGCQRLRLGRGDDTSLGVERHPIPEARFCAGEEAVDSRLAHDVADPLRTLDLHERLCGRTRLCGSNEIEVFVIAGLSPAGTPASTEADNPTVGCPVGKRGMAALRTRRGGNPEGAQDEAADECTATADAAIHEDVLEELQLVLVILVVLRSVFDVAAD